ncbi:MAG TPA: M15 family metallopeptidase [Mobilitalea sp.]|nr:M15 family metallopeptidase [Mobilitalea sp.]
MSRLTEQCKDVKKLNKLVQTMLLLAMADIQKAGVTAVVYETYRTQDRQIYLYCQGRSVKECIIDGIDKALAMQYCSPEKNQITWTLDSVHTTHKAVDLVPKMNGKLAWDHTTKEQLTIINAMAKYGFECGINWGTNKDSCHYQVKGAFNNVFTEKKNTTYVTQVIQKALNQKMNAGLVVDGIWGKKTTAAVNKFRKSQGYKTAFGQIGVIAFEALMK